jgi:hypothetical protein
MRPPNEENDLPQYPVVSDPTLVADVPAEKREEEMRNLLRQVIAQQPEAVRASLQKEFEGGAAWHPISSSNPETARLLSRWLSLRELSSR